MAEPNGSQLKQYEIAEICVTRACHSEEPVKFETGVKEVFGLGRNYLTTNTYPACSLTLLLASLNAHNRRALWQVDLVGLALLLHSDRQKGYALNHPLLFYQFALQFFEPIHR